MSKSAKKSILKKISLPRLVLLIFFVMTNTFAWFIYSTKIDSSISVHVKAWNIMFQAGQDTVTDIVDIDVESIYPGMSNYSYTIDAYNQSEVPASLSYQVLEARILNTTYISVEGRAERGQDPVEGDLTSAQLITKLANDYPFSITTGVSNTTMVAETGQETYSFGVIWPYEQGNDALDTTWGINAANYKESNPTNSSIALRIKIIITQNPTS